MPHASLVAYAFSKLFCWGVRLFLFCPILAGWIRRLIPGRPWAHASAFPFRNDEIICCSSYAVDGHVFLLSECLHHYWCEFCQSRVQRRDPRWVHDPRRSWGIGISEDCPCHSVEFPQKHFLLWARISCFLHSPFYIR